MESSSQIYFYEKDRGIHKLLLMKRLCKLIASVKLCELLLLADSRL